jgi:hypothetical protein
MASILGIKVLRGFVINSVDYENKVITSTEGESKFRSFNHRYSDFYYF